MQKFILTLAIMTVVVTVAVQLPSAFAVAPPQGGDPHGEFGFTPSSGDPHTSLALHGAPHLCETIGPDGNEIVTQC